MIDAALRAMNLPPRPRPLSRLGAVAPVPFVGVAAILVALIVFTPVLFSSGPSALAISGYLFVYRGSGSLTTDFEVAAYDQEVAYAWINVSVGTGSPWTGGCPASERSWSYLNETDALAANEFTGVNPVVIRATATYLGSGIRTVFAGELAFYLVGLNTSGATLEYAPCSATPGMGAAGSWSLGLGTRPFPLVNYGSGGPS